ncbi:beta-L-arabinofuranosidase domain-containing protein [Paenibacillus qinlingensis]|uniref:RIFT barrel domain-containing protein n=1 Tax=Paenibacillus qinlingensis TaxID=1837343 RepID=UPI00286DBBBA|nr:beta-L-arabinofuranosidase domain-containing protein [Paenibacillus qinlingensis]
MSKFPRHEEPSTIAVPFAEGMVSDSSKVSVLDGNEAIPTQTRVTATWPDGSVKWLLLHFLADLPSNLGKSFMISTDRETVLPAQPIGVQQRNGSVVITTGALEAELSAPGETGLFRTLKLEGGVQTHNVVGPTLRDASNQEHVCQISAEGWRVLESGPIRCSVEAKGKHLSTADENRWFDFVVRVYAFAGKPWLMIDYQIINKELAQEQVIHAAELRVQSAQDVLQSEQLRLGISRFGTDKRLSKSGVKGDHLSYAFTAESLKKEFIEDIPETFCGTFWADLSEQHRGGISVTLFQAPQNLPKSLEVTSEEINVGIIPAGHPITMMQGMAKTHRFFLHVHGADEQLEQVNVRSLQMQMPDHPVLERGAYERAGIIESIPGDQFIDWVERGFYRMADGRAKTFGMLHWGDAPDKNYTFQGRGNGDWVWVNNEYDLPHAMMHLFARTGKRRFYDYMLRGAEHWMDVDICHFSEDPLRQNGQIMHSGKHVTGLVKICHEWVEGLLDYYHMTGEQSALTAAIGIGDNIRRILNTPRYQGEGGIAARESGWALRSLTALYNETYEEKWLEAAERIVDHFTAWKNKFGTFLSPATDHTVYRSGFMICVAVNSLMRYYRIRPQEQIKQMIVDVMDDYLEHCYVKETGLFYYKELPSTQKLHSNPICLEALSYAYEFTGEVKFLEAGRATFREGIDIRGGEGEGREISGDAGDALIFWGDSPKKFAQYYYPIFYYYQTILKVGIQV